jgi:hypothetical protein
MTTADLEFLRAVFNWARGLCGSDGRRLVTDNPVTEFAIPRQPAPRRPIATYDRFAAPATLRFGRSAGTVWSIHGPGGSPWLARERSVPVVGERLRSSPCAEAIPARQGPEAVGDRQRRCRHVGAAQRGSQRGARTCPHAKPRCRRCTAIPRPDCNREALDRWHARNLLHRAEALADLPRLRGGAFQPYRRKWATERKHLPMRDVAEAGGWKTPRTLELWYFQPDPATMLAVVTESRKLREAR